MAIEPDNLAEREPHLDEVATAYLKAVEAGAHPNRDEWLARYPDIAAELREFFADQDRLDQWATPLRIAAQETPRETPSIAQVDAPLPLLDDYELLRELGRGGMGVVYEARQKSLNRLVAVKLLNAAGLTDPIELHRFRAEAEMVAALDHPGIVPIYEVGEWRPGEPGVLTPGVPGVPYFSMKLIEGGSLAEAVVSGQ